MRSFLSVVAVSASATTAFVVPARRHALTRRAAHDDSEHAATTTKTTTTMPNYVEQANYFDGDRPAPAWELAQTNFLKQGATILAQVAEAVGLQKRDPGAVLCGNQISGAPQRSPHNHTHCLISTQAPCPRRWVWSCRTRP